MFHVSFFHVFSGSEIIIGAKKKDMKAVIHLFIYLFFQNDLIRLRFIEKKKVSGFADKFTKVYGQKSHIKKKSLFLFLEIKYILRTHCLFRSETMVITQVLFHREETNIALKFLFNPVQEQNIINWLPSGQSI